MDTALKIGLVYVFAVFLTITGTLIYADTILKHEREMYKLKMAHQSLVLKDKVVQNQSAIIKKSKKRRK